MMNATAYRTMAKDIAATQIFVLETLLSSMDKKDPLYAQLWEVARQLRTIKDHA
jgi:hypothetical protein